MNRDPRSLLLFLYLVMPAPLLEAADWWSVGPFGGDVRSLAVHPARPDRFFLGTTDGQIFVSLTAGQDWIQLTPGLQQRDLVIDNLVFHPQDPDTLYAGCWELKSNRGWVFRTRDGGASWESLDLGDYATSVRALAIAPSDPRVIAVGIAEGVILSEDEGQTWDRITRGYRSMYNVESLAFDPTDASTIYVGTWRLGWKTVNRGKKWEAIHEGMYFDSDMFSLLVDPRDPSRLFASACTGVYRSSDAGAKWAKLNRGLPSDARRTRTLAFDPSDSTVVYAGTTQGLFASRDGGDSWTQLLPDLTVNSIAVQPGGRGVVLIGTDDAGVLRSTDSGESFDAANRGFTHRQVSALAAHPSNEELIYASIPMDARYGGFFYSTDAGGTWSQFNEGLESLESSVRRILPSQAGTLYLVTGQGVFAGTPPDGQWELIPATQGLEVQDVVFADMQETALLLATSDGIRALTLGARKVEKRSIEVYKGPITALYRSTHGGAVFAGTEMGVFRSDDQGRTWTIKVHGLPPTKVVALSGGEKLLLAGTQSGLYWSSDQGENWHSAQVEPIEIPTVRVNPNRPQSAYAVDATGGFLFESHDGGLTWTASQRQLQSRVLQIDFSPSGRLLLGTLTEGVMVERAAEVAEGSGTSR